MEDRLLFYSQGCHAPLSRRQFVAGSVALALATVSPRVARAASDPGRELIQRYATRPDDPWAVAHGVRALGRDFRIQGGRLAVDFLLDRVAWIPAGDGRALGFPLEMERHPDAFLSEALLDAGVGPDHAFLHEGQRRTVQDLIDGARARFRPSMARQDPDSVPWTLLALVRATPPARGRWQNGWGETVDLDLTVAQMLQALEVASRPLEDARRAGRAEAVPAPVQQFTCGGTHMLYAVLTAMDRGYGGGERRERAQQQTDLLVWRLRAELALIDRFYRERGPAGEPYRLDARLKLLGHAEECLAFAVARKLVRLTGAQQDERRAASATVRSLIAQLRSQDLSAIMGRERRLYSQLVGDTCHAQHGLAGA